MEDNQSLFNKARKRISDSGWLNNIINSVKRRETPCDTSPNLPEVSLNEVEPCKPSRSYLQSSQVDDSNTSTCKSNDSYHHRGSRIKYLGTVKSDVSSPIGTNSAVLKPLDNKSFSFKYEKTNKGGNSFVSTANARKLLRLLNKIPNDDSFLNDYSNSQKRGLNTRDSHDISPRENKPAKRVRFEDSVKTEVIFEQQDEQVACKRPTEDGPSRFLTVRTESDRSFKIKSRLENDGFVFTKPTSVSNKKIMNDSTNIPIKIPGFSSPTTLINMSLGEYDNVNGSSTGGDHKLGDLTRECGLLEKELIDCHDLSKVKEIEDKMRAIIDKCRELLSHDCSKMEIKWMEGILRECCLKTQLLGYQANNRVDTCPTEIVSKKGWPKKRDNTISCPLCMISVSETETRCPACDTKLGPLGDGLQSTPSALPNQSYPTTFTPNISFITPNRDAFPVISPFPNVTANNSVSTVTNDLSTVPSSLLTSGSLPTIPSLPQSDGTSTSSPAFAGISLPTLASFSQSNVASTSIPAFTGNLLPTMPSFPQSGGTSTSIPAFTGISLPSMTSFPQSGGTSTSSAAFTGNLLPTMLSFPQSGGTLTSSAAFTGISLPTIPNSVFTSISTVTKELPTVPSFPQSDGTSTSIPAFTGISLPSIPSFSQGGASSTSIPVFGGNSLSTIPSLPQTTLRAFPSFTNDSNMPAFPQASMSLPCFPKANSSASMPTFSKDSLPQTNLSSLPGFTKDSNMLTLGENPALTCLPPTGNPLSTPFISGSPILSTLPVSTSLPTMSYPQSNVTPFMTSQTSFVNSPFAITNITSQRSINDKPFGFVPQNQTFPSIQNAMNPEVADTPRFGLQMTASKTPQNLFQTDVKEVTQPFKFGSFNPQSTNSAELQSNTFNMPAFPPSSSLFASNSNQTLSYGGINQISTPIFSGFPKQNNMSMDGDVSKRSLSVSSPNLFGSNNKSFDERTGGASFGSSNINNPGFPSNPTPTFGGGNPVTFGNTQSKNSTFTGKNLKDRIPILKAVRRFNR